MNISPQERKALQARYSSPKGKILKWVVIDFGFQIFEHQSPAICETYIKQHGLTKAYKKPIYEPTRQS